MSSLYRSSMRCNSTLGYGIPRWSAALGSRFSRAGPLRHCTTGPAVAPLIDMMAVRSNAITQLAAHMNYVESSDADAPVIESMIRHLMDKHAEKKKIPKSFVNTLLDASITMHKALPNIVPVERLIAEASEQDPNSDEITVEYGSRLSVLGDLHGYYDDLAMLFKEPELGDMPSPYNQYIFNGDLVDRGPMSVETVVTVLFCNLLLPNAVHILRGNHETQFCNKQFGFMTEVLRKYDVETLNKFHALFDALPVGAVFEGEYFVVHGGLGTVSGDSTIEELNKVDRFCEPKQASVVSELLWSDPLDGMTGHEKNKVRAGEVTTWGPDISEAFLTRNNLQAIIRSHEFMEEGFSMCHDGLVWTVFSAPNYEHGANLGALVRFQGLHDNLPTIIQYSSAAMKRIADAEKAAKEQNKSADA